MLQHSDGFETHRYAEALLFPVAYVPTGNKAVVCGDTNNG
jgi:hypothetical protein